MELFGPGRFILYQQPSLGEPLWPAVVCLDDMAPKEVHEQRPRGYNTLILLMEKFDFAWALPGEMSEYDPGYNTGPKSTNKQLKDACDLALNSVLDDLDLDHWKAVMHERRESHSSFGSGPSQASGPESDVSLDWSMDRDVDDAFKINTQRSESASIAGSYDASASDTKTDTAHQDISQPSRSKNPASTSQCTTVQSSVKRQRVASLQSKHTGVFVQSGKPSSLLVSQPRKRSRVNQEDTMPGADSGNAVLNGIERHISSQCDSKAFSIQSQLSKESFMGSKTSRNKKRSILISEQDQFPDAEIKDHEGFVEFVVGPNQEVFYILKSEIDRRQYFANNTLGANWMVKVGKNKWSFQRPCLQNIDPDDFRRVAEYLSTEKFGLQIIENTDQKDEAFAECFSVWGIADSLVIEDLLDHIVQKMETLKPWGQLEVLAFADEVYKTEDAPLLAYRMMKDALSRFVADHYLEYLRNHLTAFGERLVQIPEFLDDVHRERGKILGMTLDEITRPRLGDPLEEEQVDGVSQPVEKE